MSETATRVLLVEDNPDDVRLIRRLLLRPGARVRYALDHAGNLAEALTLGRRESHDVVLLDLGLPDSRGLDTLRVARQGMPEMPIVVLTGLDDEAAGVEAIQEGAQDYLYKGDIQFPLLRNALRYAIERNRIKKELDRRNAELQLLQQVAAAASRTIRLDELVRRVCEAVREAGLLGGVVGTCVFLERQGTLRRVFKAGGPPGCPDRISPPDVATSGLSAFPGPDGCMDVPLAAEGRFVGLLRVCGGQRAENGESRVRLLEAIGAQLGIAVENARLYEETRRLALHDPLTNLGNRRLMDMMIEKNFARAARGSYPLSLVMFDIDDFKQYNDALGHAAGDQIIRDIARIIFQEIRTGDFAARYGGEEFLLLLPGSESGEAAHLAERLRASVMGNTAVTISLGVASYHRGMKQQDLVRTADQALYEAKRTGKNRVVVY